jgi:pimeloyl-ACP methyl ester carboxylesterase
MNRLSLALCAAALCFIALVPSRTAAATLVPLPAPAESFDIGFLHVDRYGSGPSSIIIIPGLACGPWEWAREITLLSRNDTVYALTLSGFDGRPYTISGDPFDEFSRNFWALLDARKIERPVVIGHSLGGTLALTLAEEHSDRLAGVLALDGLPVFPALAQADASAREKAARGASAQIAAVTHDQLVAYERVYMQQIGTLDPSLVEPTAALEARSDPKGIAAWISADLSRDLRPGLVRITIPLIELMPYASPSPYTQAQTVSFYQSLLLDASTASVVPIENARHFAMLDQPEAVDAGIKQLLAQAHP